MSVARITPNAPVTVQYTSDLKVVHANDKALAFVGKSLDQVKRMTCAQFWNHHKNAQQCKNCPLRMVSENKVVASSLMRLHEGGNWWYANFTNLYDEHGYRSGILAQYTEVSDPSRPRKPVEQLLERQYLNHPHPQIIAEYHSGNIILANTAAQEVTNIDFDELSNYSIYDLNPITPTLTQQILDELRTFGISEGHVISVEKPNQSRQFAVSAQRIIIDNTPMISIRLHDVTENRHLKNLLERLEQRFHSTLAVSRINVWEFNLLEDHFYIYVPDYRHPDQAVKEFDTSSLEAVGLDVIHPDDRLNLYNEILRLKKEANEIEITYRVFNPQTNEFEHHHLRGKVSARNEEGVATIAQGTIMNIGELKYFKEELSRSNLLYEHLFTQSPVLVVRLRDDDGTFIDANKTFLNFCGKTIEECIGKTPPEIGIWPGEEEEWTRLAKSFEQMGEFKDIQIPLLDEDGNPHQVILSASYCNWDGTPCTLVIGLDITEEYQLRQELLQTQQRMQDALDAIHEGYFDWNVRTNGVFANENFYTILGYTPGEFPFTISKWGRAIYRKDRIQTIRKFQQIATGELNDDAFRFRVVTSCGAIKWVMQQHRVIEFGEDGLPLRVVGTITDLTEQIKIEQELQKQKETLEATFNAIEEGVWEFDLSHQELILNDRCKELVDPTMGNTTQIDLDNLILKVIHPDDIEALNKIFTDYLEGLSSFFQTEIRLRNQEKGWIWCSIRGAAIDRMPDGSPSRLVGTIADINERKQLEENMRLAQAGIEQTSLMAFLIRPDATFQFINQEACEQLGYTAQELYDLNAYVIDPTFSLPSKEAYQQIEQNIEKANRELFADLEMTLVRKDGSSFPAKVSRRAVRYKDTFYFWAFAINISNIKEMEKNLRQERENLAIRVEERTRELAATNELLEVIIQTLPIPVYFKDENFVYIDANQAFADYFGYTREQLVGKGAADMVRKEFADPIAIDDRAILEKGIQIRKNSLINNKDGEVRDAMLIKTRFINPENGRPAIVGTFIDITDSVKMKTQLEDANRELNRALQIKDEFLANMSHELRTPLTSVIGYSELMLSGMGGKLHQNQVKYLNHIQTAGHHLLTLINDLLDYSKFNAEVATLEKAEVSIRTICLSVMAIMEPRAFKKDIRMDFEFDDELTSLYCDARRINQVLINLINNAIKFSNNYDTIGLRVKKITEPFPAVEFQVWDKGIGIAPEDQERIFEPFTQAVSDLQRKYEGSGIGLALAKKFVELHDGTISVESEPGKGSLFIVRIPLQEKDE